MHLMKARLGMKDTKSRLRERLSAIFLESGRSPEKGGERRRKAGKMMRKRRRRMSRRLHQPKEKKKKAEGRATWIHSGGG